MQPVSTPAEGHIQDVEASTERLRLVLRATREAVWDWDVFGEVMLWNDGLQAFGYAASDVGGDAAWLLERIHPNDRERIRQGRTRAAADARQATWEDGYQLRRADGSYADVVDRAVITRDRRGAALRMVGALADVTIRNRQAAEIQKLAGRLRDVASAAKVATWQFDASTAVIRADGPLEFLWGDGQASEVVVPFEEVLRFVHPDDRAELLRAREEAIAGLRPFAVEHRVVLEHGEIRWVRSRGRISLDERGRVQTITGTLADVTDLKLAEQSMALLAEASRILAESLVATQILDATARMVVPTFADGCLVHMSAPPAEVLKLVTAYAADAEFHAALRAILDSGTFHVGAPPHRVLRSGLPEIHAHMQADWFTSEDIDERMIPLVRRYHVTSSIFVPIALDGATIGVVAFFSTTRHFHQADVALAEELARRASHALHNARLLETATRERARAEEAQSLRERLLAIVGHDLRNPLTAITMATQTFGAREGGPAARALVKRVESSAARMSRLIGEVLDFARIRQGMSLPIELAPADLHELCRNVVDELRLGHPEREVTLDLEGEPVAICDAGRIAEVVSNLVGNAIQHGAEGSVDVRVFEAPSERVGLAVHNLGWIPGAAQGAIFDAYRREGNAGDPRSKSIGLGLYIAKEIVKAHQGTIDVASTPAEGTTFTIRLPRRPPHTNGGAPAAK